MPSNNLQLEAMGVNMPYNIESEQAVLGAIIINCDVYHDVVETLEPAFFYSKQNAEIYRCIQLMMDTGVQVDFVSLLNRVEQSDIFDTKQAAKQYLFEISQTVPAISNAATYAKIVYERYLERSLLNASSDIIGRVGEADLNGTELLDFAEQRINDIRNGRDTASLKRFDDVMSEVLLNVSHLTGKDREKYLGIPTGYGLLDSTINGLKPSNLIIIAARPSVGKTSFALNIVQNILSSRNDKAIAFFSLEMSRRQLAERFVSGGTDIPFGAFQTGDLNPQEITRVVDYKMTMSDKNLYLDDSTIVTVPMIKAKARRISNLGLIVVDYLQLMTSGGRRTENRVQEISDITRQFKLMAKELDVPVILLSQLSRENVKQKRMPVLSDLRDSGSIEQDADIVMFLHRQQLDDNKYSNETFLIVLKNRHGPQSTIKLVFDGEHARFLPLTNRTIDD